MSNLTIDGSKTALVVIDLQKGIASMDTQPYPAKTVVANAVLLAEAFRKRGMPVYLVRVAQSRGTSLSPLSDTSFSPRADTPPDWAEIVPELGPAPSDVVITKRQWGAFYGTDLELRLRRGGADTVVLCGIATTYGVESTARYAYEYGFQQVFAEDAMSDRSADAHRNAVELVLKRIGRVRKTREILDALPRP
ncbi:MAG: hydrolase [Nitrososphaerota archaeon]|jgi:nicotinamidase-related amidase|nr:hydrolase [Nitrososphaerota archaeon]MDG6941689.1 hydrolase [Nitrososphaerota archaeon]MDG6947137.1 hydrolase [Nitrososphaerota archaeon]MDG6951472.1 hydrolase [Nitrososphaerota archaeon]